MRAGLQTLLLVDLWAKVLAKQDVTVILLVCPFHLHMVMVIALRKTSVTIQAQYKQGTVVFHVVVRATELYILMNVLSQRQRNGIGNLPIRQAYLFYTANMCCQVRFLLAEI